MSAVTASAPCRVDLAGGTLDLWPLSQLVPGAMTVNLAIGLRAHCRVTPGGHAWRLQSLDRGEAAELDPGTSRPETRVPAALALPAVAAAAMHLPPAHVETWSEVPAGSGLGGSSALLVALLGAMAAVTLRTLGAAEGVALAVNLETRVLGMPAGCQDHWAAWQGGGSLLAHELDGARHEAMDAAAGPLAEALVVVDTGVAHHSGMNNWSVLRSFLDGEAVTRQALAEVAEAARRLAIAVRSLAGDALLDAVASAMEADWEARRRLSPAVSSPEIERLVAVAAAAGGGGRACGAGGGGMVACLPRRRAGRAALERALAATGARLVPARLAARGLCVAVGDGPRDRDGGHGAAPEAEP